MLGDRGGRISTTTPILSVMFRITRPVLKTFVRLNKKFSTEAPKVVAPEAPKTGGSSFFQRLSSFLAGCGVGFGVSFYFIYNELIDSNERLVRTIKQIEGFSEK